MFNRIELVKRVGVDGIVNDFVELGILEKGHHNPEHH